PGETVEATAEFAAAAVVVLQRATSVQTRIDVGLDALARTDDEVGVAGYVVDQVAADLRDVLLTTGHLPDPAPQALAFEQMPFPARVSVDRYVGAFRVIREALPQVLRRRMRVVQDEVVPQCRPF